MFDFICDGAPLILNEMYEGYFYFIKYVYLLFKSTRLYILSFYPAGYHLLSDQIAEYLRNRPDSRITGYKPNIRCDPRLLLNPNKFKMSGTRTSFSNTHFNSLNTWIHQLQLTNSPISLKSSFTAIITPSAALITSNLRQFSTLANFHGWFWEMTFECFPRACEQIKIRS